MADRPQLTTTAGNPIAKALQKGAKTPTIARFSTVAGELGAADAERDVRGFAVKFYTKGNWHLVGNSSRKSS